MESELPPERTLLLERVDAALDTLLPANLDPDTPGARARDFLRYKLYATFDLGERVRQQIPTAMPSVQQIRHPDSTRIGGAFIVDRGAGFMLFVLVDSFLFEAGSVRDALAQVANVVFALGIPVDDLQLGRKVLKARQRDSRPSGLEPWFSRRDHPPWLASLIEHRNITTHRQVVRLPTSFRVTSFKPEDWAHWPRRVLIGGDGAGRPLDQFVQDTEHGLANFRTPDMGVRIYATPGAW